MGKKTEKNKLEEISLQEKSNSTEAGGRKEQSYRGNICFLSLFFGRMTMQMNPEQKKKKRGGC